PIAIGIGILKYRLYDVDLVIRKTVVLGILAAFTTAVYVAIVVGLGSLFTDTLLLRIAATALVAIAFQPVRVWARRLANRLVFGERATPYEVMAGFSERVADAVSTEEVLPQMAGAGVGAAEVTIRVALPDGGERVERWQGSAAGGRTAEPWGTTIVHQGDAV